MNIMPSISILAAGGGVIAILAALLWFFSQQARLDHARLLKARFAHLHEPQLGAYPSPRVRKPRRSDRRAPICAPVSRAGGERRSDRA
jgi:hypothetical protein